MTKPKSFRQTENCETCNRSLENVEGEWHCMKYSFRITYPEERVCDDYQ